MLFRSAFDDGALSETTLVAFRRQHRKYIWGSERLDEVVSIQLLLGTEGRSPKQIKAQTGGAVSVFRDLQTIWRRQWQPTPVLLPGKSHGQRSLVGCSPWGLEARRPGLSAPTEPVRPARLPLPLPRQPLLGPKGLSGHRFPSSSEHSGGTGQPRLLSRAHARCSILWPRELGAHKP